MDIKKNEFTVVDLYLALHSGGELSEDMKFRLHIFTALLKKKEGVKLSTPELIELMTEAILEEQFTPEERAIYYNMREHDARMALLSDGHDLM